MRCGSGPLRRERVKRRVTKSSLVPHKARTGELQLRNSVRIGVWSLCVLLAFLYAGSVRADDLVLNDVPAYYWYHGSAPTSGMMVFGYWANYGYANLIPGGGSNNWTVNQSNIQRGIASGGHITDYAFSIPQNGILPQPDQFGLAIGSDTEDYGRAWPLSDASYPGSVVHADNCLADFMGTSRAQFGMTLGVTHGVTREPSWNDLLGRYTIDPPRPDVASGMVNYASYAGVKWPWLSRPVNANS
jgi:hypothetical protein